MAILAKGLISARELLARQVNPSSHARPDASRAGAPFSSRYPENGSTQDEGQPTVAAMTDANIDIQPAVSDATRNVMRANKRRDTGPEMKVRRWLHGGKDAVAGLIQAGRKADASFKATARQTFVPAASRTDRTAIMFDVPYYTETSRGLIPAWRNEVDPGFWESWLTFDPMKYAPKLSQPFLMVKSEAAALPAGARQFVTKVPGDKHELWLDGVSQFDFYDQPAVVSVSVDTIDHYLQNMRRA
ncbi:hypothetical protein ABIE41_000114 [Bosea sp. OAE506]|uniref:hypothetical protein n=1 Tax=Bosea sp. OAE506 TaxID=2663870 RepID=UPI00178BB060